MPNEYLTYESPDAFKGIALRACPVIKQPRSPKTAKCPRCKGHGEYNLRLNAYGEGKHSRALCIQCNGFGWVAPGLNASCVHDFNYRDCEKRGHRVYRHTCTKCGTPIIVEAFD